LKKVIVSVTNDLFSDQRVDKVCNSLTSMGFDVVLVGRCYHSSPTLAPRRYKTERMHLLFKKGAKFYAEYNIRLFFYLLFHPCDVIVSNDLDTLLPSFLASKMKHKGLVYDSHEYFCGVPEIIGRPFVQNTWRAIERFCFPKLEDVITVNQSIADIYDKEYPHRKNPVNVIRNIPTKEKPAITETRSSLGMPEDKKVLLLQGAGINVDRGSEELVSAMKWVDGAVLFIVGSGDAVPRLKQMVADEKLEEKVRFVHRQPFAKLFNYTYWADIGFSLDKDTNINYRYSLPNKIFDYIKAGTPVIASNLPEIAKVISGSEVGIIIENHQPETIAAAINQLITDEELLNRLKEDTKAAAEKYCWENEETVLKKIYSRFK